MGGAGNIGLRIQTCALFFQIAFVVEADGFKAVYFVHAVGIVYDTVFVDKEFGIGNIDDAFFAQNRITVLCFEQAFFADHKIAVTRIALAGGSLYGKKTGSGKGHIGFTCGFFVRTLRKIGKGFVRFHTEPEPADNGRRIRGTEGSFIHAVVAHAPYKQFGKIAAYRRIFFKTGRIDVCQIVGNHI